MKGIEGIDDAKTVLTPWITERAKDAATLKQPLVVMLFRVRAERSNSPHEQLLFSDRLYGNEDHIDGWVDELLEQAADACEASADRVRFVVRIKDDSRHRRFTLHAHVIDRDMSFEGCTPDAMRALSEEIDGELAESDERKVWVRFAAAAISNTAAMIKPTNEGKPAKPTGTGGRPTAALRQYTTVAADTVAQYASRVANEMLKSYRERWRKR